MTEPEAKTIIYATQASKAPKKFQWVDVPELTKTIASGEGWRVDEVTQRLFSKPTGKREPKPSMDTYLQTERRCLHLCGDVPNTEDISNLVFYWRVEEQEREFPHFAARAACDSMQESILAQLQQLWNEANAKGDGPAMGAASAGIDNLKNAIKLRESGGNNDYDLNAIFLAGSYYQAARVALGLSNVLPFQHNAKGHKLSSHTGRKGSERLKELVEIELTRYFLKMNREEYGINGVAPSDYFGLGIEIAASKFFEWLYARQQWESERKQAGLSLWDDTGMIADEPGDIPKPPPFTVKWFWNKGMTQKVYAAEMLDTSAEEAAHTTLTGWVKQFNVERKENQKLKHLIDET